MQKANERQLATVARLLSFECNTSQLPKDQQSQPGIPKLKLRNITSAVLIPILDHFHTLIGFLPGALQRLA